MDLMRVSFSLKKPAAAATKRKRPRATAAPALTVSDIRSEAQAERSRALTGCFNTALDDSQAEADGDELLWTKQPRLQLEDAQQKSKRLQSEGNTLAEAGRFRSAMARWIEATVVDPANAAVFELLAQASMALFEDFRAIQFALRATQLTPTWGDSFHTLARCHLNYGELDLALQHINKAIELKGNDGDLDELVADREEIETLLLKQCDVIAKREAEEAKEVDEGRLQALSCLKHLSLRGQTKLT